jgi:uncharacterized RDD family membrane protein YckC
VRGDGRLILTPEHVHIRLTPAGLGSRFVGLVVDLAMIAGLSAMAFRLLRTAVPGALGTLAAATAAFVVSWGYHVYFEVRHQGRSPGKRLVGIRVVDGRGLPIGFEQSFVRNVVRVLDAAPIAYGLGALACRLDRDRRRLGDIAADTLVIREGRAFASDRRVSPSRQFNSLRTPRVLRLARRRVGLDEREFLAALCWRSEEMEDRARFDLMQEVGQFYREKLEIDDPHLSGENLVRGLTSVLVNEAISVGGGRASPRPR